ncbi:Carbohydrate Sulfotransferase 10 [Manis pentadactyla]|nr:Carbohydrate Sulfotransferase 10 [Manis pentadactyla]
MLPSLAVSVDNRVQDRGDNGVKYSKKLIHRVVAEGPHIDEDAWAKEEKHHCDVSSQGGMHFAPPGRRLAPNGDEDQMVGDEQNNETAQRDHPTVGNNDYLSNISIFAGEFSNQREITENAVHYIGATERQVHDKGDLKP